MQKPALFERPEKLEKVNRCKGGCLRRLQGCLRRLPASTLCYCDSENGEVKERHPGLERADADSGERTPSTNEGGRGTQKGYERATERGQDSHSHSGGHATSEKSMLVEL